MKIIVEEMNILNEFYVIVTFDDSKIITFKNYVNGISIEVLYDSFDIFQKYPIVAQMISKYKDNNKLSQIKHDFEMLANICSK